MSVTLINVFELPKDQRDEFLKRWTETTQIYARTEGFLETQLHENTGIGSPTFQFINIALWASNEAFIQAHKDYVPGEESIAGISDLDGDQAPDRQPMHRRVPVRTE